MSAIANPSPQTAPPLAAPVSVPARGGKSRRKWLYFVALAIVIAAGYLLRPAQKQQPAAAASVRTGKVAQGLFQQVMRVAGVTSARNYAAIAGPMMRGPDAGRSLILMDLVKSGAMVKKGEIIAQIDAQAIKDHVDDLDSTVKQAEADIAKRTAEQAIQKEDLQQNLRIAKAALDKARLDASASEIRTSIDIEQLKLNVDETQAQYSQIQRDIGTMDILHRSEIRILEYTRDRHARHRDRHKGDIEKFTIHSSMNGLAVMNSVWRSGEMGQIQQGDQVGPGQSFMKVVDPNSMQVDATVNQVESEGLRIGQNAEINFDAFADLHLAGKVESIGALAIGGWRQQYYIRNIPVRVRILGSDPRVIPDLSASANIILHQKDNAISVPLESVFEENGKTVVYVKQGDTFYPKQVQVGLQSQTRAEILSGLKPGEEIALQHPVALPR